LIAIAGWFLSKTADVLAKKLSEAFVGSIVLGLITTAPEYYFVILTLLMGEYEVSVGSTIGANIVMITLGYGLVVLIATREMVARRIGRLGMDDPPIRFWGREMNSFRFTLSMMLLTSIFTLMAIAVGWHPWIGVGKLLLFALYVKLLGGVAVEAPKRKLERRDLLVALGSGVVGAALLYVSGHPFVEALIELAEVFHVPPLLIALILSPLATELPEKITAYTMAHSGEREDVEISIYNFLGTKFNNNTLLFGMICLLPPLLGRPSIPPIGSIALLTMFAVKLVAVLLMWDLDLTLRDALILLALYPPAIAIQLFSA
jgi:cation:H+ antiporter